MVDRGVQLVREWLERQPFNLRMITLILFLVEAVEEECGEEMKTKFENDLRGLLLKLPISRAWDSNKSHGPGPCWCGRDHTIVDSMLYRARDLFRDDPKLTTEKVAHTLSVEYRDLAKEFGVTPEALHTQSSDIACQVAETLGLMAKWNLEEKAAEKKN